MGAQNALFCLCLGVAVDVDRRNGAVFVVDFSLAVKEMIGRNVDQLRARTFGRSRHGCRDGNIMELGCVRILFACLDAGEARCMHHTGNATVCESDVEGAGICKVQGNRLGPREAYIAAMDGAGHSVAVAARSGPVKAKEARSTRNKHCRARSHRNLPDICARGAVARRLAPKRNPNHFMRNEIRRKKDMAQGRSIWRRPLGAVDYCDEFARLWVCRPFWIAPLEQVDRFNSGPCSDV